MDEVEQGMKQSRKAYCGAEDFFMQLPKNSLETSSHGLQLIWCGPQSLMAVYM